MPYTKWRLVERVAGSITLHDVSRDGRVLLTRDTTRLGIICLAPGAERERELSWFDWSLARDLSPDGRLLLFTEAGEAGGSAYGVTHCYRRAPSKALKMRCSVG